MGDYVHSAVAAVAVSISFTVKLAVLAHVGI